MSDWALVAARLRAAIPEIDAYNRAWLRREREEREAAARRWLAGRPNVEVIEVWEV